MEKQRGSMRMGLSHKGNNRKKTLMALRRNCCSKNKARLEKMKPSSDPWTARLVLEVVKMVKGGFQMRYCYLQICKFWVACAIFEMTYTCCLYPAFKSQSSFQMTNLEHSLYSWSSGKHEFGTEKFATASLALERTQYDNAVPYTNNRCCKRNLSCKNEPRKLKLWSMYWALQYFNHFNALPMCFCDQPLLTNP